MPTSNETIPNRKLSGLEVKECLRQDFNRMLDQDGLLAHHMAFGRIGYEIVVKLHLDNPMYLEHKMRVGSVKNKSKPEVDAAPLPNPSKEAVVVGSKLENLIDSPNKERVSRGMEVPVTYRDPNTGRTVEKGIKYDKGVLGNDVEDNVKITDVTEQTKAEWELK